MRNSYRMITPVVLAALVIGVAALPARADAPLISQAAEVDYGDLDLAKSAGVERLYARMQAATDKVCGARYRPGTLVTDPGWRTCIADALDQAVADLDVPTVTAYHAANAGRRSARTAARLAAADARN